MFRVSNSQQENITIPSLHFNCRSVPPYNHLAAPSPQALVFQVFGTISDSFLTETIIIMVMMFLTSITATPQVV